MLARILEFCFGLAGVVGQNSVPPLPPFGDLVATGRSPCPSWPGLPEMLIAILFINAAAFAGTIVQGYVILSVAVTGVR